MNSREVIITMNRLNGYVLGEIGTRTGNRIPEKIWIDVNWFSGDVMKVLPPC